MSSPANCAGQETLRAGRRARVSSRRGTRGFTLLEMMVALSILATSYVALMQAEAGAIRMSTYGKQLTIATFLAQAKLEEVEEKLTREGFPDMDDTDDGNFEEQGFPSFRWKLEVNKVELPIGEVLNQLLSNMGGEGEEGEKGEKGEGGSGLAGMLGGLGQELDGATADKLSELTGGLGGQLGGQPGGALGGAGGGMAGMLNPEMLSGSVEMLSTMLEQSLREVRVTVHFGEGDDQVSLTTHLVQVPQAPGGAATGQGGLDPNALDPNALNNMSMRGGAGAGGALNPAGTNRGGGSSALKPSVNK
jgi:general secretion pathway protein I